jgi:hypothetical protein
MAESPAGVGRDHIVGAIVDDELAVVFAAVLDGEGPDVGVVGEPFAKFRCLVQSRVALLLDDLRPVGYGLLHELNYVGLGLESATRRIITLAEVGAEV